MPKPENVFDAGKKLSRTERLRNIIVGTEVKARNGAVLIAGGGQKNDGDIKFGLDRSARGKAVALRQRHVKQHQIRPFFRQHRNSGRLSGHASDNISCTVQIFSQVGDDRLIIFY